MLDKPKKVKMDRRELMIEQLLEYNPAMSRAMLDKYTYPEIVKMWKKTIRSELEEVRADLNRGLGYVRSAIDICHAYGRRRKS